MRNYCRVLCASFLIEQLEITEVNVLKVQVSVLRMLIRENRILHAWQTRFQAKRKPEEELPAFSRGSGFLKTNYSANPTGLSEKERP